MNLDLFRARSALGLAAALMAAACGSGPSAPSGSSHGGSYTVGDSIAFDVAQSDSVFYTFHAPRDGTGTIYVQSSNGSLAVSVIDSASDNGLALLNGHNYPHVLLQNFSTPFTVHSGQPLLIRVYNGPHGDALSHGRLFVSITSDAPENMPAAIAVGTAYQGESLSLPGDIDQFVYPVVAGHRYTIYLQQITNPDNSGIAGRSVVNGQLGLVFRNHPPTSLDANATAPLRPINTGFDTVTFSDGASGPGFAPIPGQYRFEVREINLGVESGDSVLTIGDTVTSTLDYGADIDQFVIPATQGDTILVYLQELGGYAANDGLTVDVFTPAGSAAGEQHAALGEALSANQLGPFLLTAAGTYHLRVSGIDPGNKGDYRLRLLVAHPTPPAAP